MAQFNSELPQPKSKWAVRPKQEWCHKHGSGLLDDPRWACPEWLWLEALPVSQQKYMVGVASEGEQGNWQETLFLCRDNTCPPPSHVNLIRHRVI